MTKIYIEKGEVVSEIVEKLAETKDDEATLVVPRHPKIRASLNNFKLLKKEADKLGKSIIIESVDEEVLAFATAARIENFHPLFSSNKLHSLSDVLPKSEEEIEEEEEAEEKPKKKGAKTKPEKKVTLKIPQEEGEEEEDEDLEKEDEEEKETEIIEEEIEEEYSEYEDDEARRPFDPASLPPEEDKPKSRKWLWFSLAVFVLAGIGVYLSMTLFAKAEILINFVETEWSLEDTFTVSRNTTDIDLEKKILPGELFKDQRTLVQPFDATGRSEVSQKASGKIVIVNAYSSQPQTLVATTRFITPEGKIYRLDGQVIVPGAAIKDGKIIPASTEATVSGDKAGPEYNSGPVEKLTIPGFQGTPKYEGFYGKLAEGAKDGYIGERAVPTDEDIEKAKVKVEEILKTSLQNNLLDNRPEDFVLVDGGSKIEIGKITVNKNTDENGKFSVFGEAKFQAVGFRRSDLEKLALEITSEGNKNLEINAFNASYLDPKPDFTAGTMTMKVKAEGSLIPSFDQKEFINQVSGKSREEVRNMISRLPELADGSKIIVWPPFLTSIPTNTDNVKLEVKYP